jgi:signal peptidase II
MKLSKHFGLRILLCVILAWGVFVADQYIKYRVLKGTTHSFLNGAFGIGPFYNRGIAFSINLPDVLLGLAIMLSLVFVLWLAFFQLHSHTVLAAIAAGLILGGSSGNAYDRIQHGAVVDYVHVFHTSVFNFADVAIAAGLLMVVILLFHGKNGLKDHPKE